jgi:uncharacterized protein YndB with AHSA1/START domain
MKITGFVIGAGLILLAPSAALAQQSAHLSAQYLKQATPLIHWPDGLEPRNADVFVHDEAWINAPVDIVWANLIDAAAWPTWYANSANVRIAGTRETLTPGTKFQWTTFGVTVESTVDTFEPGRELGWTKATPSSSVHHAWALVPEQGGTRVITEEAQKGPAAIKFRLEQPSATFNGHDWWLSALKARSEKQAGNAG